MSDPIQQACASRQLEIAREQYAQQRREGVCPDCLKDDRRIQSLSRDFWKCKRCNTTFGKSGIGSRPKKRKPRELPRGLRRAYRSKNRQQVTKEINNAMSMGFTKAEIQEDFQKWKQTQEFIE